MGEVDEARDGLVAQVVSVQNCNASPTCDWHEEKIMAAADAYGAARELKGHVGACRTGQRVTDSEPGGITMSAGGCGDCNKAEEIRKLGK